MMIGDMIAKARKEKGMSKTELARLTDINIGHLTHIEKGERNPSHKVLKNMCKTMGIPYRSLMYTYDKELTEEQLAYKVVSHIPYDKIPTFTLADGLIECPTSVAGASIAIKISDTSMEPRFKKDSYVFVEFNTPLDNKDVGLFSYNGKLLIRKFIIRKDGLVLRAEDKEIPDICLDPKEEFYIVGKIVGSN